MAALGSIQISRRLLYSIGAGLAVLSITVMAGEARAGQHPHARDGWHAGIGIGGGSAGITGNGSSSDREMGTAGSVRGGYVINPKFGLGLEANMWFKTIDGVDWTFSTYTLAASFYPSEGLLLRAGVGGGDAEAAFDTGPSTLTVSQNGFGVTGGVGYEIRLGRGWALVPQIDASYIGMKDFDVNYVNVGVAFHWYQVSR